MSADEWKAAITAAMSRRPKPVGAVTFLRKWGSFSQPVALRCDDGVDYVVKGLQSARQMGRPITNEQIVGRIGRVLGAPIPDLTLVNVPKALIDVEPQLSHLTPGVGHGIKLMAGCTDKKWLDHFTVSENRPRFAALALLYGWVPAGDHQLIYETMPPYLVHSVDHGHFFHGGPYWTLAHLPAAPAPAAYADIMGTCKINGNELVDAMARLKSLADQQIAEAVSVPLDEWGITLDERVAIASYLSGRRDKMLALKIAA